MLESFEEIGKGGSICVECSDILYRIHDAVTEKDKMTYDEQVSLIKSNMKKNKLAAEFEKWFTDDFMKRNGLSSS